MTRKKKGHSNDTDELWSRKFDENEGYTNGNYSRTERKKADKAISPVLKSLWIFLALFIILPTSVYLWYTYNDHNTSEPESQNLVVKENESSSSESENSEESESESESESSESSESEEAVESETSLAESETVEETESVESSEVVESESQPTQENTDSTETSQPVESESVEGSNTYTVQPGDNLYRIALNHGMTLDELKALNGLPSNEVSVGTVLVVQ